MIIELEDNEIILIHDLLRKATEQKTYTGFRALSMAITTARLKFEQAVKKIGLDWNEQNGTKSI